VRTILIVEDDRAISMVLGAYLRKAGYAVVQVYNGDEVMNAFERVNPSLILLDVMLPGEDGWSLLKRIRERSACPVIILSAISDIQSKLDGLYGGADDYMAKPFIGEEVAARVEAVLRRRTQVVTEDAVIYGNLKIDFAAREVTLHGRRVELTPRDLSLLMFFAENPNRLFDREQLIRRVWGMDYEGSDRAVDLAVKRLRKSLAAWPKEEGELVTLRGMGYKFRVNTQT
jgi:DNA-binding response OmpR family regulator